MSATPEEIRLIDAALDRTGGNRAQAAQALGMDERRVYHLVCTNAHLKAKWATKHPEAVEPTPATEIHRDPALRPFSPMDRSTVVALNKQDLMLQKGWEQLGFNDKERGFLAQLQGTYASNLQSTMDLAYGGSAHANTRLLIALEQVKERLKDIEENPDEYTVVDHGVQGNKTVRTAFDAWKDTYALFISISGELRKMSETMTKANQLRLQMLKLKMDHDADARKTAGWTPPAAAAPAHAG